MPRTKKIHQLKIPRLRQDWSKWNLYNLSRVTTPPAANKTFFQQKWMAKAMTRSYHNPFVREGTWTRMFDRRLPSVVPMDHRYLAANDGSEMASGRGMGKEKDPKTIDERNRPQKTPYMHMTFWPLERRLDTAIHRALFASSVSQARQFVVHGFVKVNGKKMIYPGYQLNPGDMFSVDPDMVMFATGARKIKSDSPKSTQELRRRYEARLAESENKAVRKETGKEDEILETTEEEAEKEFGPGKNYSTDLKQLMRRAKTILEESKLKLSAKRQQELRAFSKQLKTTFSKIRSMEDPKAEQTVEDFETALAEILAKVPQDATPEAEQPKAETESSNPQAKLGKEDAYRARKDAELLHAALERARANPIDSSKPYATPWEPREFMSAFAFIPRYLEVNQKICSAVYLRHPVARPGLAEVPTPFSAETMALGFNWYLRRR
ncbi:Putative ribosomal protein S4/S9 [Septoria linicola]|uniref:Ribosomal protein S4/S9 n=1 Tax=Septoria linicola TaxID=215465 RepID=A0A9Q9ANN5_9PEZI|nr:putative ribosomal protein S4/S9 [Septoria linicola]USW49317.1 Putative ribosomal protein S4/S9 [Septoria linicola]